MKQSEERILTTHTGSLPRTDTLVKLLNKKDSNEALDQDVFNKEVKQAIKHVINKQHAVGIDIPSDGEQPRISYSTYVYNRMEGFGGEAQLFGIQDLEEYPELIQEELGEIDIKTPKAVSPINYSHPSLAKREIDLFHSLVAEENVEFKDTFLTAASPGVISVFMPNTYYDTHKDYLFTLAKEMKQEYELIADSGSILQLDCPDLAMARHQKYQDLSTNEFKNIVKLHVEAINKATQDLSPDQVRIHLCYGNYEGPHHRDIPLEEILPLIYEANVGGILIELANPRHQHEYTVFEEYPLPEEMAVIPGVIDVKTNFIEHPQVVANRIQRVANAVGDPTKVLAGTDCGFGTFAGQRQINKNIVWKKLESLAEGAALASNHLF